jgi:hypothetical protein
VQNEGRWKWSENDEGGVLNAFESINGITETLIERPMTAPQNS